MDISQVLLSRRDEITRKWAERLKKDVSPAYSAQPMEDLYRTVSAAADANCAAIARHDFSQIDAVIEWIGKMRSKTGFSLSEVEKAFELYRAVLLPILGRDLPARDLLRAVQQVNECLSYTLSKFSDYFQALHEAEIRDYARRLEAKVKKRTQQLAESEATYRTLVEKIRDGYFVNQGGKICFANKAFCTMHGYAKKEVVGRPFADLVASESVEEAPWIISTDTARASLKEQYIYLRLHKNGMRLPTENTVALASYQGRMAIIGICRDITERMEIERRVREAEGLARIGHLSTSLAHEIRNPLSSAKMSVQMILKGKMLGPTDQRRVEILAQQISRLENSVTQMLDLARPVQFEFASASMTRLIDACLEILDAKLAEKQVHVRRSYSKEVPVVVMDEEKMEQAMVNLLINAIEAVDNGGRIHITVKISRKGGAVEVSIRDNGCGVREEDLPYIFDPFFSRKPKGTGLGLANARRVIEAHGASIEVFPGKKSGICFRMVFPLTPDRISRKK